MDRSYLLETLGKKDAVLICRFFNGSTYIDHGGTFVKSDRIEAYA